MLLLIFLGMFDFGMMLNRKILLTEAAREGARYAAVAGASENDVREKVTKILGVTPSSLSLTPCPADSAMPADATVVLTFSYTARPELGSIMLLFGPDSVDSVELRATGVMACVG